MPCYIMKLTDSEEKKDYYLEWSTIVDAPITWGLSLQSFKAYYRKKYGSQGMADLPMRLERVEKGGISAYSPFDVLEAYFEFNCAGPRGAVASKEYILENYCKNRN